MVYEVSAASARRCRHIFGTTDYGKPMKPIETMSNETSKNAPPERRSFVDCAGRPFVDAIPQTCQLGYEKALKGVASPRQAIKAFCMACTGYVRADVAGCTAFRCALWMHRPFQDAKP
jgi:hypothetical protein